MAYRILVVLPRVPFPQNDGGAQAMWQLTEGLLQRGHKVHWLALNTQKHWVEPDRLPKDFPIHTVPIDTSPSAWAALGAAFFQRTPYPVLRFVHEGVSTRLQQLVRETAFDAVILETAFLLPYVWALRAATNAPIISRSHNVEHRIWQLQAKAEPHVLKKLYWSFLAGQGRRWEMAASAEADAVASISPEDEGLFREAFRALRLQRPVSVVRPGVALPEISTRASFAARVGYLGALDWKPNLLGLRWFLESVWPAVRAHLPEATFHLAGKRPAPEVATWRHPGLFFQGEVPDAAAFWDGLDLAVVPVTVGGGVRLKVLECLSRGVPMVTTPLGATGAEELVGEGFWAEATASGFAARIVEALKDPSGLQLAAIDARQRVGKLFGREVQWDELENLLHRLLRSRDVKPSTAV